MFLFLFQVQRVENVRKTPAVIRTKPAAVSIKPLSELLEPPSNSQLGQTDCTVCIAHFNTT